MKNSVKTALLGLATAGAIGLAAFFSLGENSHKRTIPHVASIQLKPLSTNHPWVTYGYGSHVLSVEFEKNVGIVGYFQKGKSDEYVATTNLPGSFDPSFLGHSTEKREEYEEEYFQQISVQYGDKLNPMLFTIGSKAYLTDKDGSKQVAISFINPYSKKAYPRTFTLDKNGVFKSSNLEEKVTE